MAKSPAAEPSSSENKLLARLPQEDYERLFPHLQRVPLEFKVVLSEPRSPIDQIYFPCSGVVSSITLMDNGDSIEVATVGKEGLVGLLAFLDAEESPHRQLVQVPGEAWRMKAPTFRAEASKPGPFRKLISRYHTAFHYQVSQSVACNGLHTVQRRCCRWILMTHDRAGGDVFPLTHEFLAHMLGVRRVSITEVLKPLQKAGLVSNRRGEITVLDRPGLEKASCECYREVKNHFERLLG